MDESSRLKIYLDEDAMDSDLAAALRSRGVTVIAVLDSGLTERPDEEQLVFATDHGCVLYTFNVSDFCRLHTQWISAGREHAGMILAPQQRFSVSSVAPHPKSARDQVVREYEESG
jgi:hypothetical protein